MTHAKVTILRRTLMTASTLALLLSPQPASAEEFLIFFGGQLSDGEGRIVLDGEEHVYGGGLEPIPFDPMGEIPPRTCGFVFHDIKEWEWFGDQDIIDDLQTLVLARIDPPVERMHFQGPFHGCGTLNWYFEEPLTPGARHFFPCEGFHCLEGFYVRADIIQPVDFKLSPLPDPEPLPDPPPVPGECDPPELCELRLEEVCSHWEFENLCPHAGSLELRLGNSTRGVATAIDHIRRAQEEIRSADEPDLVKVRARLSIARETIDRAEAEVARTAAESTSVLTRFRARSSGILTRFTSDSIEDGLEMEEPTRTCRGLVDEASTELARDEPALDAAEASLDEAIASCEDAYVQLGTASRGFLAMRTRAIPEEGLDGWRTWSLEAFAGLSHAGDRGEGSLLGLRADWQLSPRFGLQLSADRSQPDESETDDSTRSDPALALDGSVTWQLPRRPITLFGGPGWIDLDLVDPTGTDRAEEGFTIHVGSSYWFRLGERAYVRTDLRIRRLLLDENDDHEVLLTLGLGSRTGRQREPPSVDLR